MGAEYSIPLIFITDHGDDVMRVQVLRTGAVAFLRKPFREEALLEAVEGAIQRARLITS